MENHAHEPIKTVKVGPALSDWVLKATERIEVSKIYPLEPTVYPTLT